MRSGELGLNRSAVLGRYLFSAAAGQVDEFGEVPGVITLMEQREWEPVTGVRLIGFGISFGLFLLLIFRSEPGFVFLLDHANLLFHEAGHPAVGLFSSRLETYGGTLGQLVFPVVLAVSFWRKGQVLGFAAACIWFFENWFNIARYTARGLVCYLRYGEQLEIPSEQRGEGRRVLVMG